MTECLELEPGTYIAGHLVFCDPLAPSQVLRCLQHRLVLYMVVDGVVKLRRVFCLPGQVKAFKLKREGIAVFCTLAETQPGSLLMPRVLEPGHDNCMSVANAASWMAYYWAPLIVGQGLLPPCLTLVADSAAPFSRALPRKARNCKKMFDFDENRFMFLCNSGLTEILFFWSDRRTMVKRYRYWQMSQLVLCGPNSFLCSGEYKMVLHSWCTTTSPVEDVELRRRMTPEEEAAAASDDEDEDDDDDDDDDDDRYDAADEGF